MIYPAYFTRIPSQISTLATPEVKNPDSFTIQPTQFRKQTHHIMNPNQTANQPHTISKYKPLISKLHQTHDRTCSNRTFPKSRALRHPCKYPVSGHDHSTLPHALPSIKSNHHNY
eukprot:gene2719-1704_t